MRTRQLGLRLALLGSFLGLCCNDIAEAAESPTEQQNTSSDTVRTAARELTSLNKYEPDCDNPVSIDEAELCVQLANVAAAEEANTISRETIVWTRRGLAAIVLTLLASAWAAWAAARAARIAEKSLHLFKTTEMGLLAPHIGLANNGLSYTVSLHNRGRTPVTVIHADVNVDILDCSEPIPFVRHNFPADLLIKEGGRYEFGEYLFPDDRRDVLFLGGAIYKTFDWESQLCRIAVKLDRQTGKYEMVPEADFSQWEKAISGIRPLRWWQFWRWKYLRKRQR